MKQDQTFTYNTIPNQQLRYANELTIAKWNSYINELKTQANDATTYIETLHKWLIGTNGREFSLPESKSFAEYVLSTLSAHTEKLQYHDNTLPTPTLNDINKFLVVGPSGKYHLATKQLSISYVYSTQVAFIECIEYEQVENTYKLTRIKNEQTSLDQEFEIGTNFYIAEKEVPDYWLVSKEITLGEGETFYPLLFFQELETKYEAPIKFFPGAALELREWIDGELIYCTENSSNYKKGNYYYYNGNVNKVATNTDVNTKLDKSEFNTFKATLNSTLENTNTSINDVNTKAESIKNNVNNNYYTKTATDTKFATKEQVNGKVDTTTYNSAISEINDNINTLSNIKQKNITVSNWASDTTYSDYNYRASISISGVTSAMIAEVNFGLTEAISGNYAPICETFNGGIYIYSKVNTAITIPTILVVK